MNILYLANYRALLSIERALYPVYLLGESETEVCMGTRAEFESHAWAGNIASLTRTSKSSHISFSTEHHDTPMRTCGNGPHTSLHSTTAKTKLPEIRGLVSVERKCHVAGSIGNDWMFLYTCIASKSAQIDFLQSKKCGFFLRWKTFSNEYIVND